MWLPLAFQVQYFFLAIIGSGLQRVPVTICGLSLIFVSFVHLFNCTHAMLFIFHFISSMFLFGKFLFIHF